MAATTWIVSLFMPPHRLCTFHQLYSGMRMRKRVVHLQSRRRLQWSLSALWNFTPGMHSFDARRLKNTTRGCTLGLRQNPTHRTLLYSADTASMLRSIKTCNLLLPLLDRARLQCDCRFAPLENRRPDQLDFANKTPRSSPSRFASLLHFTPDTRHRPCLGVRSSIFLLPQLSSSQEHCVTHILLMLPSEVATCGLLNLPVLCEPACSLRCVAASVTGKRCRSGCPPQGSHQTAG